MAASRETRPKTDHTRATRKTLGGRPELAGARGPETSDWSRLRLDVPPRRKFAPRHLRAALPARARNLWPAPLGATSGSATRLAAAGATTNKWPLAVAAAAAAGDAADEPSKWLAEPLKSLAVFSSPRRLTRTTFSPRR